MERATMENNLLTDADWQQLEAAGISRAMAKKQIGFLLKGTSPIKLNRPCTAGDGIVILPAAAEAGMVALHEEAARQGRFTKFVPASGAASRMFVDWQQALDRGGFIDAEDGSRFADRLPLFAFFPEIRAALSSRGETIEALLKEGNHCRILRFILTGDGLNYGCLPKALLKFHSYHDGLNRTALEEHLVESVLYTADAEDVCRLHFTVSEDHLPAISSFLDEICPLYERVFGATFRIGISRQSTSTNTLALDGEALYRNEGERLVLRPGGHGALLENLQSLGGDIVFIKNIDNVAPDWLKSATTWHKKVLSGYFLHLEQELLYHLGVLTTGDVTATHVRDALHFCRTKLLMVFPATLADWPLPQQQEAIISRLNRPLRVCGMVRNEGEPGGGPFWTDGAEGQSLQIVELHQIDGANEEQRAIWAAATHFNPVDVVCGLRDHRGRQFDLSHFADQKAVSLTHKIERGRKIKVLEHPGPWNGGMSHWNTVFIEVPITTFNPVKTIDDLLRLQHLPALDQG